MANKIKKVHRRFDYRQCDDFAAYLNYMARQGWHFKEFRSRLVFEKGEPEDAVYAVEIFTDGTAHDMRPSYKAENFAEYCQAAGWQLIDQRVKWCVLKRTREDAWPIFTDEERFENVKNVTNSTSKALLWVELLVLVLMFGMILYSPKVYLFSLSQILWSVYWPVVFLRDLHQMLDYRRWCRECEARLERGEALHFRKRRNSPLTWVLAGASLVISLAYFLNFDFFSAKLVWIVTGIFLLLTVLLNYLPSQRRMDAESSKLLTVLFWILFAFYIFSVLAIASYQDMAKYEPEPPVSISVFRPGENAENVELSHSATPFGQKLSCYLYTPDDRVSYFVYESQYGWVLDVVWNQEVRKANQTATDCAGVWEAEDAFRTDAGRYVVRYEDRILILRPGLDPLTQAQIDAIISALKEG